MKKFTNWLLADKWLWFAIGLAVAAFFGISLGMRFVFCPAFFAAFGGAFWVKPGGGMSGVLPAYGGGGAVRPFPLLHTVNPGSIAAARVRYSCFPLL